jgi:hypothetical protein
LGDLRISSSYQYITPEPGISLCAFPVDISFLSECVLCVLLAIFINHVRKDSVSVFTKTFDMCCKPETTEFI